MAMVIVVVIEQTNEQLYFNKKDKGDVMAERGNASRCIVGRHVERTPR